jgi:hypothetical protein
VVAESAAVVTEWVQSAGRHAPALANPKETGPALARFIGTTFVFLSLTQSTTHTHRDWDGPL